MLKTNFLYLSLFLCTLLAACGASSGTTIQGTIANGSELNVFLDQVVGFNGNDQIITSQKIDSDNTFKINIPEGLKTGIYKLRIGQKSIELVIEGTEKIIEVNADLNTIQNLEYTLTGSPMTENYMNTLKSMIKREIDVTKLQAMAEVEADPLVAFMIATRVFNFREEFAGVHRKVADRLKASKYATLGWVGEYDGIAAQLEKQYARTLSTQKIQVGMAAPEIALPGPDGKIRKLSDYKGKVVLIDFWASWCGPCRKANPKVVEIYKKYKSKGFDVFSVSLDGVDSRSRQMMGNDESQIAIATAQQKERWVGAIQADNLIWDGHVSDLKKWEAAPAAEYGVTSIPKTFLLDREGKIFALDPRNDLEEQVIKALNL